MVLATTDDFTRSPYQYDQFATPTSIRLVKILRKTGPDPKLEGLYGSDFQWISCSCETFDLANHPHPNYYGLSYTWGYPFPSVVPLPGVADSSVKYDQRNKIPILINDKIMFVGKNLYYALCHLPNLNEKPQPHGSDENIVLQSDDVERRKAPYNKTRLIRAAEKGYYDYVLELLEIGAEVNAKDKFGNTGLHYAAENGHFDIIRLLVTAGADHTIKNAEGLAPMQVASQVSQNRGYNRAEIRRYLADPWAIEFQDDFGDKLRRFEGCFWIDAICINQSDLLEKNAQVALMGKIYEEAAGTFIWLGPADDRTLLAKQAIALICSEASDWWLDMALNLDSRWEARCNEPQVQAQFEALNGLLMRPWFQRIWIVQEVAKAKEVRVLCGKYSFPWHILVEYVFYNCSPTAMKLLKQSRRFKSVPTINSLNDDIVTDQLMLFRMILSNDSWERTCIQLRGRELGKNTLPGLPQNEDLTLANLLFLTLKFKASEPRDRVFALLGLCGHDTGTVINYEQPIAELFTLAAFPFMQGSNAKIIAPPLLGLTVVEGTRIWQESESFRLPSWVPDFSMPSPLVPLKRDNYSAGMALGFELELGPGRDTIFLRGVCFDIVDLTEDRDSDIEEQLSHNFKPKDIPACAHDEIKYHLPMFCPRSFFRMALSLKPEYPGGGTRVEALWRIVTNNAVGMSYDAVKDPYEVAKKSFKDFVVFLLEARAKRDGVLRQMVLDLGSNDSSNSLPSAEELAMHPVGKQYHPTSDTLPWDSVWKQWKYNIPFLFLDWSPALVSYPDGGLHFNDSLLKYYRWRRLFRTSRGFLGMGSRRARAGDEVWLISGAPTPFLLRPVTEQCLAGPKKFELLGEAYVHNVMAGEAARDRHDEVERIELV